MDMYYRMTIPLAVRSIIVSLQHTIEDWVIASIASIESMQYQVSLNWK